LVQPDQTAILRNRLIGATFWLLGVVFVGAGGFQVIGRGQWTFGDCVYFTIITLSTVGYEHTLSGFDHQPWARVWTVGLIVLGSGTLVYFVSTITAFIVEGDLGGALRRNRMNKLLTALSDHIIVCGVGKTGIHVIEELVNSRIPFCAIDQSEERLVELAERFGADRFRYVVGDAADDDTLQQAGVARCAGVISALSEDKDNLFVTITASALNPQARIVAKANDATSRAKLVRAGAKAVVSPTQIGGLRLASEAIRPKVVEFLDLMLRDPNKNLRIEEVAIPDDSPLVGAVLSQTNIRKASRVLVIAVRFPDGRYEHNPDPDFVLERGVTLIVLAESKYMAELREGIKSGKVGRSG
jgi:voltage-gated potassium channel